jgi:hypothetical protein
MATAAAGSNYVALKDGGLCGLFLLFFAPSVVLLLFTHNGWVPAGRLNHRGRQVVTVLLLFHSTHSSDMFACL